MVTKQDSISCKNSKRLLPPVVDGPIDIFFMDENKSAQ